MSKTDGHKVTRFGVSIPKDILLQFDAVLKKNGYKKRSRAMLDLVREYIKSEKQKKKISAVFQIMYNHRTLSDISVTENSYPCTVSSSFNMHIDLNYSLKIVSLYGEKSVIEKLSGKYRSLGSARDINLKIIYLSSVRE
ncbi:MAG TPA: hypothetical protein DC049_05250 [Spirochaetia bacterium]|nr:hypothetical protein [Spirochaetia bacterium]